MNVRMRTSEGLPKLRGRIAELGVRQVQVAALLGLNPSLLSAYLRGLRQPPTDFEERAHAALDRLQAAEEARQRVLAETETD